MDGNAASASCDLRVASLRDRLQRDSACHGTQHLSVECFARATSRRAHRGSPSPKVVSTGTRHFRPAR
jgi:hypothetical protein